MAQESPVGIGFLGCGNIAGPYAEDLARFDHVRLVGAFDLDHDKAREFAGKHGMRAYETLDELLADPEVEVVANLSIHHAHYETTKRCLEAGKHVHSEKPLALTSADSWDLVRRADAVGIRLGSSPFTWMGPASQTLARAAQSGEIGPVRMVYAEVNWNRIENWHPNPEPFYRVGSLWDVGVYPLTLCTAIFGPVTEVRSLAATLQPDRLTREGVPFSIEAPDWNVTLLTLSSGVRVRLTTSFFVGESRQRASLEIHGDAGTVRTDDWLNFDAPVEQKLREGEWETLPTARAGAYVKWGTAIADLASSVREGRPHRATGAQAAHIVDVLEACNESQRIGAPVAVTSTFQAPEMMPAGAWGEVSA